MTASILRAEGADQQRDSLMAALYSILFAFVVETANHKLFPGDEAIATLQRQGGASILHFNSPGFANHSPSRPGSRSSLLVRALDGFDDFVHNYQVELQRYWGTEQAFDGDAGIAPVPRRTAFASATSCPLTTAQHASSSSAAAASAARPTASPAE